MSHTRLNSAPGRVGNGGAGAERVMLRTRDAVRLAAVLLHVDEAPPSGSTVLREGSTELREGTKPIGVVLLPGFSGCSGRPGVDRVARALTAYADVLVVDLRGHGASAGLSTLGDREVFDVDAAVGEMRRRGYDAVVTVGWSMGGTCALRHAALVGEQVHLRPVEHPADAVVAVSSAGWWFYRGTAPMRRLHWLVQTALGRRVARRVLGVRIDSTGWAATPLDPAEAAARLRVPLLVVHGDADGYLPVDHARAVAAAAGSGAELWEVPGFGHAEEAADPELLARIGKALPELVARGRAAAAST